VVFLIWALVVTVTLLGEPATELKYYDEWTYGSHAGPLEWDGTCATGKEQSPINLDSYGPAYSGAPIRFNYNDSSTVVVKDTKHGTMNVAFCESATACYSPANTITIKDKETGVDKDYTLLQFHFHANSEHTVDQTTYPAEVHFVHLSQDGKLAVIGVFFDAAMADRSDLDTEANDLLANILKNATIYNAKAGFPSPNSFSKFGSDLTGKGKSMTVNPKHFMKAAAGGAQQVWTYDGSLTTPPCSEGLAWHVFKNNVLKVDARQFFELLSYFGQSLNKGEVHHTQNYRLPQPLNGRTIKLWQ